VSSLAGLIGLTAFVGPAVKTAG